MTIRVKFDSSQLTSEEDIMDAFNKAFDFPDYFGRNWDAWIDCMSDELTGDAIEIMVTGTDKLIENHREVFLNLIGCVGATNRYYQENGKQIVLLFR